MEIVSQGETSKTNTENRKKKSVRIEEKEKNKRKDEEQREVKKQKKKQRTEEMKEVQKGFEDKGKHTYSLRYKHCNSSRFKVEDTQHA